MRLIYLIKLDSLSHLFLYNRKISPNVIKAVENIYRTNERKSEMVKQIMGDTAINIGNKEDREFKKSSDFQTAHLYSQHQGKGIKYAYLKLETQNDSN